MAKETYIYEKISPGEVFIISKDKEGFLFIGNTNGEPFVKKVYYKDEVKI